MATPQRNPRTPAAAQKPMSSRQDSARMAKPTKRKVTTAILEQCLFGTSDSGRVHSFSQSFANLTSPLNNTSTSTAASPPTTSDQRPGGEVKAVKGDFIDDMLEPDGDEPTNNNNSNGQVETITYERPDGASIDVTTDHSRSTDRGSIEYGGTEQQEVSSRSLSAVSHDKCHDSKFDESAGLLTESLMDLGLGGGDSDGPGNDNATKNKSTSPRPNIDQSDRNETEAAALDEWIEGDVDAGVDDDEENGGGGIAYTKADGGDIIIPLKAAVRADDDGGSGGNDGDAENKLDDKSAHEMDTMSDSMSGRLRAAAEENKEDDDGGYGGYGGETESDDNDDESDSDKDAGAVKGIEERQQGSAEETATAGEPTPSKGDECRQTPPPTPTRDTAPARPTKDKPTEAAPNKKHIYDANEIGSLSSTSKREEHARRVRSAKVGDALADLEGSMAGFGLEDRWSKREAEGEAGAATATATGGTGTTRRPGSDVKASLTLQDVSSLDAPQHDRNDGSSLCASGSLGGLGLSSSSVNSASQLQPQRPASASSANDDNSMRCSVPTSPLNGTLPTLSEESSSSPTHMINLQELRRLSSQGIPEEGSHRALAWRVLMGYLPPDTSKWEAVLKRDRDLYRNLVAELFVKPGHHDVEADHLKTEGRRLQGSGMHKDGLSVHGDTSNGSRHSHRPGHNSINMIEEEGEEGEEAKGTDNPTSRNSSMSSIGSREIDRAAMSAKSLSAGLDVSSGGKSTDTDRTKSGNSVSYSNTAGKITRTASDHAREDGEKASETVKASGETKVSRKYVRRSSDIAREMMTKRSSMLDDSDCEDETAVHSPQSIEARRNETSNEHNDGQNAPMPVHTPQMLVPARVREQWKESGRDSDTLAAFSDTSGHMNALLVIDDQGNTYDENGEKSPKKDGTGRVSVNDDPLSLEAGSKWAQFFENASLLDEIRKDVVRTHPDLTFFLEPEDNLGQRRYAAVERILFVWAKLNKGVRYVQGMNEIVATLYFVLANDSNEEWACEAEADTYFLFNTLMVEMRDIFVPDLDHADTGIQGRISNMIALLSLHDPEVRCHLDDCGIDGSFYSIRWLTTLLSREFILPDTIRLWDSMFASTHKDNFMRYVCVTMVMLMREELLRSDFGTCLRLLQAFPPTDVDRLLEASRALWIYESQVTLACHKGGISLHQALLTIAPPPSIIMAYGLPGGVALSREERMRQAGKESIAAAKGAASRGKSSAKNFFGNAKQAWGEWRGGLRSEMSDNGDKERYHRSKTSDW